MNVATSPSSAPSLRRSRENERLRAHVASLRAALKDYYHECRCRHVEMDEVNRDAYRALRATEAALPGEGK